MLTKCLKWFTLSVLIILFLRLTLLTSHLSMAKKNLENCSFPGQVVHVAAKVAEIKRTSLEEVLEANLRNSRQIYSRYFESRREVKTLRPRIRDEAEMMRKVILARMSEEARRQEREINISQTSSN